MTEGMLSSARTLSPRVDLTFPTGAEVTLPADDIVSFAIEEGADSALLPGSVLSSSLELILANDSGQWREGGSVRGNRTIAGSTARVYLILNDETKVPCGVHPK